MKIKKRLIMILGIAVCIGMCIPGLIWYMNYQKQADSIKTQSDTMKQNETVEENTDFTAMDSEDGSETEKSDNEASAEKSIVDVYSKIGSACQHIIDVQKTYINWYNIFSTDYDRFDEAADGMRECQQTMSNLFAGSGTKDQLWYTPNVEGISPVWAFKIGLNYSDATVPVSWICTDENSTENDILSAVTAKYDIEADSFFDEHIYVTYLGDSYIVSDEDTEETQALETETEDSVSSNQFISGVKSISNAIGTYIEQSPVEPGEIPYKYGTADENAGGGETQD